MRNSTLLFFTALSASFLTWQTWPASPGDGNGTKSQRGCRWQDFETILKEWREMEEHARNSGEFRDVMASHRARLAAGELSLAEASKAVLSAARQYHPNYLKFLRQTQPQSRLDCERVALNLVQYLEFGLDPQSNIPASPARLKELRAELASENFQAACAAEEAIVGVSE